MSFAGCKSERGAGGGGRLERQRGGSGRRQQPGERRAVTARLGLLPASQRVDNRVLDERAEHEHLPHVNATQRRRRRPLFLGSQHVRWPQSGLGRGRQLSIDICRPRPSRSKPAARRCRYRPTGQTDGQTDGWTDGHPNVT